MTTRINSVIYETEMDELKKTCEDMESQLGPEGEYFSDKIRTILKVMEFGAEHADIDDKDVYEVTYDTEDGVNTQYVKGREAVEETLKENGAYETGYSVFLNVTEEF